MTADRDGSGNGTDGHGGEGPTFETDEVFDEDYLYFYRDRVAPERSEREAEFVASALGLSTEDRVLDAPCGHGRIANPLAERGCEVVGLDRSAPFLGRAREDAASRGVDDRVGYHRGDMRELPWDDDAFDAALNAFTSFGYFDDAGNRRVLAELARVVRPGGRVLVDVVNHDALLADFQEVSVTERDGDYMVDRHEYEPRSGRATTDRLVVRDGRTREFSFSVRSYTYPELVDRFEDAGLAVVDDYGSLDGEAFSLEASRLCLVGERRD